MRYISIALLILMGSVRTFSQKTQGFCAFSQNDETGFSICKLMQLNSFSTNFDAAKIINDLLEPVGITPNYTLIPCENIENCAATIADGVTYIIYDKKFLQSIVQKNNSNWSAKFIIAHEVAHHLYNHTLAKSDLPRRRNEELEADEWAAFILHKLGASLQQTQAAMYSIVHPSCEEEYKYDHPCIDKRLAAIKRGWEKVNSSQTPTNGVFWEKSDDDHYQVFVNGIALADGLNVCWVENGLLCYNDQDNMSYLFKNYKKVSNNTRRPAQILGNSYNAFWEATDKNFNFYYKGDVADFNYCSVNDNDKLIYNKANKSSYYLENAELINDSVLRPALLLSEVSEAFWWSDEDNWDFYFQGQSLDSNDYNYSSVGNDVLIYCKKDKGSYLLKNVQNISDRKIRAAQLITRDPDEVLWSADTDSYAVYFMGNKVDNTRIRSDDDGNIEISINFSTGLEKYQLPGANNKSDNIIRKAIRLPN